MDIEELRRTFRYNPETGELRRVWNRLLGEVDQVISPNTSAISFYGLYQPSHICWAMYHGRLPLPGLVIDHINRDPFDNRIANLRECTQQQNLCNGPRRSNNTSGYKGIVRTSKNRWVAAVSIDGEQHWFGNFDTPEAAHEEYCRIAKQHYGEFFNAGENSN